MPAAYIATKSTPPGRWYRETGGRAANHIAQQNFNKALVGDQFNPGVDPDAGKSKYMSNFTILDDDTAI
jgi:hypothetical protein